MHSARKHNHNLRASHRLASSIMAKSRGTSNKKYASLACCSMCLSAALILLDWSIWSLSRMVISTHHIILYMFPCKNNLLQQTKNMLLRANFLCQSVVVQVLLWFGPENDFLKHLNATHSLNLVLRMISTHHILYMFPCKNTFMSDTEKDAMMREEKKKHPREKENWTITKIV